MPSPQCEPNAATHRRRRVGRLGRRRAGPEFVANGGSAFDVGEGSGRNLRSALSCGTWRRCSKQGCDRRKSGRGGGGIGGARGGVGRPACSRRGRGSAAEAVGQVARAAWVRRAAAGVARRLFCACFRGPCRRWLLPARGDPAAGALHAGLTLRAQEPTRRRARSAARRAGVRRPRRRRRRKCPRRRGGWVLGRR